MGGNHVFCVLRLVKASYKCYLEDLLYLRNYVSHQEVKHHKQTKTQEVCRGLLQTRLKCRVCLLWKKTLSIPVKVWITKAEKKIMMGLCVITANHLLWDKFASVALTLFAPVTPFITNTAKSLQSLNHTYQEFTFWHTNASLC